MAMGTDRYIEMSGVMTALVRLVDALDEAHGGPTQEALDAAKARAVEAGARARGPLPEAAGRVDGLLVNLARAAVDVGTRWAADESSARGRLTQCREEAVSALGLASLEARRALARPDGGDADAD